jgi:hypothetical protein
VPCKYGDFEYPESAGFSGSAGKAHVKGYVRGGAVKGKGGSKLTAPKGGLDPSSLPMSMQPIIKPR